MARLSLLLILGLASCSPAFAFTGMSLLAVEPGARPSGMGGAFTAVTLDPYSAAYNPAASYGIGPLAGSLGHNAYWQNIRIETAYLAFQKRAIAFATGIQFAVDGDIQGRGETPSSDYDPFDAHDVALKMGAAFRVDKDVIFGVMLGWIFEKIERYRGSAFCADLGLLTQPTSRLNVGLAVTNLGGKMQLREEEFSPPTAVRVGASYKFEKFLSAADIVMQDDDFHMHLGGEYSVAANFFLRAGYRFGYDTRDFSAGAGFVKRNLRIDYAFVPYKGILRDSHLINLTFHL